MRGLYPKYFLLYGAAAAGLSTAIFYLTYTTGWYKTHSMSGLLIMVMRIFFLFVVSMLAMSRMRKAVGRTNFMMIAVHVILITMVASLLSSAYITYFYQKIDPKYEVNMYANSLEAKEYALQHHKQKDSPKRLVKDLEEQIVVIKELLAAAMQRVTNSGYTFSYVFKSEFTMWLFSGLLNGMILGLFFGYLLKDGPPQDTSQSGKVLYKQP